MAEDPAKTVRDRRLDELKAAKDALYERERSRIEAEVSYQKGLKRRGGAAALAHANAQSSKLLVIQDINTFLAG